MTRDQTEQAKAFQAFEHDGWDTVHAGYERHFSRLTRQSAEATLDAAGVSDGMRVLDVCCGPGMLAAAAAARGAEAVGLDFSATAIDIARTAVPAASFHQGDAQALPFDDDSFDAVICGFGIIHLPDPLQALGEMHRVLRVGRRAAASVWLEPAPDNGFGLLFGAIQTHADLEVPLPPGPDFFQFSAPGGLESAFADRGFRATESATVELLWDMEHPTELVTAILEGSVRARGLMLAQTDDARASIGDEVAAGMKAFRTPDPRYRIPMPAIVGSGRK